MLAVIEDLAGFPVGEGEGAPAQIGPFLHEGDSPAFVQQMTGGGHACQTTAQNHCSGFG